MFDETIRQKAADGSPLVDSLAGRGIIPGIKVDKGTKPLAGFLGDLITEGLDGLAARLAEYRKLGARFAKWRAVISISQNTPSLTAIRSNAHALARYAAASQEAGLVPIVEPEVLMEGDHSIERHFEVTQTALHHVFEALFEHNVRLRAMLLKPNMVLPGKLCPAPALAETVAELTLRCLSQAVPAAVPGIVFLSGGQGDAEATRHLDAMNKLGKAPWELSFSFGRALQAPALKAWKGRPENRSVAQEALSRRAACNGAARFGKYLPAMES